MGLIHVGAWDGREYVGDERLLLLFEPQADAFRRLEQNLAGAENAMLINLALGAKKGTAEMYRSRPDHSSSILAPKKVRTLYPEITFNGDRETVRVSTLDHEMKGRKGFDEMVIDVQGYELEVLKGASQTLEGIKSIQCEVNFGEVYEGCALVAEVDAYLAPFGFKRVKTTLDDRGMQGDAIYRK